MNSFPKTPFAVCTILIAICFFLEGCRQPPESKTNSTEDQTQEISGSGNENSEGDQSDASTEMQTRRKAEAGVGKRGQKLKDHHGPLATPAKALFRAEQQLIFMQVEQALRMHEIQYGYPKTHSEFMEKVIEPNRIVLPELPAGQRYEFDTTTHQLMVVTESNADQSP